MDPVSSYCPYVVFVGSLGVRGVCAVVKAAKEVFCVPRQDFLEIGRNLQGRGSVDSDDDTAPLGGVPMGKPKTS